MIGKPGLPSRTVSGPGAALATKALDLLMALGNADGAKKTRDLLVELRDASAAYETAVTEATAKVAEASTVIDEADAAQEAARVAGRQIEDAWARQQADFAISQKSLADLQAAQEERVRSDAETLAQREAAVTLRETKAAAAADDIAKRVGALQKAEYGLVAREAEVTSREEAQAAREERLKAALG